MIESHLKSKAEQWKALEDKYACSHKSTSLRARIIKGGSIQNVYQCLTCGEPTTNPIKAEKALALNDGKPLPAFDDELRARWESNKKQDAQKIQDGQNEGFWDAYSQYLLSNEWKAKRNKVLSRANYICEGCGENRAEEVHHTTYAHIGNEFLFELVALCAKCHDRIHEPSNNN